MDINREAPALAGVDGVIDAPRSEVWSVLTNIAGWPEWNPDVTRVEIAESFAEGTVFRWTAGGARISSVIREVVPEQRLVWTGRSLGIKAIHVWTLSSTEGGTLARVEESFQGLVVKLFAGPMRRMLAARLAKDLSALKAECERRVGAGRRTGA